MSNKIKTVSIGDLPIATELDDADELLLRDVSATLPENATARLSIATLRAAMGGGSSSRIESASGAAFSEATDSFRGLGTPASQSEAIARGAGASSGAYTLPKGADKAVAEAALFAGTAAMTNGASIKARYDSETGERRLVAEGAPLEVPTPTAPNHAATKGYVDARPGAAKWSEHAATQDVDLDGNKLTGLGAPTDAADAATKAYVDGKEPPTPTRIERAGSYVEVKSDGSIEAHMQGSSGRELSINLPKTGQMTMRTVSSSSPSAVVNEIRFGYGPNPSLSLSCSGGTSGESHIRASLSLNAGRWSYLEQGQTTEQFLSDTTTKTMPATVRSVAHGIHLAKEAHDQRALVEWWEPVWTPVSNVDSVVNVECSYTRTYRAAGGSLVTLEGTIEVTPDAAGQCAVQVDLPIARVGSGLLAGTAMAMEVTPPGHVVAAASVDSTTLTLGFDAEGVDPYLVGFRASYRAA